MYWKEIGKELKIPTGILNSIHSACGNVINSLWCCEMMFSIWLYMDMPQSWDIILNVIKSLDCNAMEDTCIHTDFPSIKPIDKAICSLACKIQVNSIKLRHAPVSDNWPLTKPQHFTSVAIIHHKEGIRREVIRLIAEIQREGIVSHDEIETQSVGKFSNIKYHKDLSELFVNNPKRVLIEGAPGIGKTTLAEEIVFQWSLGNILKEKKLVLLIYLRDLVCQNITSFESLIKHYIKNVAHLENSKISMLVKYIINSQGEKVVLILDGYDELPITKIKSKEFFINKVIDANRQSFMKGMLIVTSRPNVSVCLHEMVDHRVEILGFTEANRMEYIRQALKENKEDIKMLQTFLHKNPAINSYCYIPLNMTMLLYLFNELGSDSKLPTTQTGINKSFICHTISRYIRRTCARQEIEFTGTDFSRIPSPYNRIFLEMSKYSFETLRDEKVIFEKSEIENFCPNLTLSPRNWNGLGLLQAVQLKYSITGNETNVLFNFLHLSIQEVLAAHHVTSLPNDEQIKLLKKTFWDSKYFNMWIMYVGLTKGRSFSFQHFLSGNSMQWLTRREIQNTGSVSISHNIIADRIKCLYLFQCFSEAEDTEMCKYVGQLLQDGNINLSEQILNPIHIDTLSIFLTQTNIKQWKILNLSKCYLEDDGLSRFYASLSGNSRSVINMETLNLSFNNLTESSTSSIISLVMLWSVCKLDITSNDISFTILVNEIISQEFKQGSMQVVVCRNNETGLIVSNKEYDVTKNLKSFSRIFLYKCNLGNKEQAIDNVLSLVKSGKEIYLYENNLPFQILVNNIKEVNNVSFHYLSEVNISHDKVSKITEELMVNMTCALNFDESNSISLHIYNVASHNIASLEELLLQKNVCGTVLLTFKSEHLERILTTLQSTTSAKHFSLRNCNLDVYNVKFDIASILRHHQLIYLDMTSTYINDQCTKDLAGALSGLTSLQKLNLSHCKLHNESMLAICKALTRIKCLSHLNLSGNNITSESAKVLAKSIVINIDMQHIELYNCNLSEEGIIAILTSLKENLNLIKLDLSANMINDEACKHVAAVVSSNISMTSLSLRECSLQHTELSIITDALANSLLFKEFDFSYNTFSEENCNDIAHAIKLNKNVRYLNMSNCELKEEGMLPVSIALSETECLKFLNLSDNQISDSAARHIAVALCKNAKLEFLSLSKCVISGEGFNSIVKSMTETQNLKHLDVSFIQITDQAALCIATLIETNRQLEHLNFSHCGLQENELIIIMKAVNKSEMIKYLNVSSNSITVGVANEIATFISKNSSLEHLYLSNCKFNEEGLLTIAKEIKLLRTFDISLNTITSKAVSKISEVIETSQLKHFDISRCYIKEKLALLCLAINKNEHLKYLNFGGIAMNDTEAKYLGRAIMANSFLETLILSNCNLHASGLVCIIYALQKITGLKHLDLMSNAFDDKIVVMLVEIVNNNAIEYLDLSNCLHNMDVSILIKAIANKGSFSHINLSSNNIGNASAKVISVAVNVNPSLQHVNLSNNNFTDEGIKIIFNGMSKINSLKFIQFQSYDIAYEQLKSVIMNNNRLQFIKIRRLVFRRIEMDTLIANFKGKFFLNDLCIKDSKLGDKETKMIISFIDTNPHIQLVSLIDCTISTSELKVAIFNSLCSLTRLHHLALHKIDHLNEVEDHLVAVINNNTELNHLEIVECELSEMIFINIVKNVKQLSHLNISNNNLTSQILNKVLSVISKPQQFQTLRSEQQFLVTQPNSLKCIDISCNPIFNEGIDLFLQTIIPSPKLEYLNVSKCLLQSTGINTIIKAIANFTSLKYLDLSFNDVLDEGQFDIEIAIKNHKELECLLLPNCTFTLNKLKNIFNVLQALSTLKILDINLNVIDYQSASYVAAVIHSNRNLEKLSLSGIALERESFSALKSSLRILYELKHFSAIECTFTDQEINDLTVAIFNSDRLEHFNMQFCSLSDINKANMFNCLKVITTLKYFNINGIAVNVQLEDDIAVTLKKNFELKHLEMAQCNISDGGIKQITPYCSNLLHINFSDNKSLCHMGKAIANLITSNPELNHINLHNCELVSEDIRDIAKALQNLSSLQHIDLDLNTMMDELSDDMAAIVTHNKNLRKVYFPTAILSSKSIKIIAKAMSQVTLLTHVDLNVNKVDDSVATDVAKFMANNKGITEVRFSKLTLQHIGYKKLSKHLEKIKRLKYISIKNSNPSITILTKLINNNKNIKDLILRNSNISVQDMLQLSHILQDIYSLQHLDFSHAHINEPQVVDNIIISNNKLKYLQLAGCKLTTLYLTKIIAATQFCNNLVLLNLSHNNIVSIGCIKELTEKLINGHIQYLYLENCSLTSSELQNITAALNIASTLNGSSSMKLLDLRNNNMQKSCSQQDIDLMITMILNRKLQSIKLPNFSALSLHLLLSKLSVVSSLQYLDFGSNHITNELSNEIVILITSGNYVNLKQLRISKLILYHDDLEHLSNTEMNIKGINYLHTIRCWFNSSTWNFLSHMIIKNKNSIVQLSFMDCTVPKSIGEVIRCVTKLQLLRLININVITDATLMGNREILMCSLADSSLIIADPLCYRRKLFHLDLSDNYLDGRATEQLFTTIASFTALEYLILANCGLTANAIRYFTNLCTLTKLKHIDLRCNPITDEEVGQIAKLISSASQLQYINLSNCKFQFNGIYVIADVLKANTMLEHLDISLNGKDNMSAINEIFEQIIELMLRNPKMQYLKLPQILLSNEQLMYFFEIVRYKSSFVCIDLGPNAINDELATDLAVVLSSNSKLEQLSLTKIELEHNFCKIKNHLTKIRGLMHLSISYCNLTDQDANIVISTILNNQSLKTFDLCNCSNNAMSDESKLKLIEVLTRISSLEYLYLNSFTCTEDTTIALAKAIICNAKLRNVELIECNLDKNGCKSVLSAISQCKDVVLINLSYNANIGETKFKIPNLFMNHDKLTNIDVTACNFDFNRIIEFCDVLCNRKTLKYLNLSQNTIVRKAANELASLLSVLTNLEYLSLYNCQLEPTGIKSIVSKLKEFNTLQYVYLNFNKMTHDAAEDLAVMLTNNKYMRKFSLPQYDESYIKIGIILRAMKSISSLQYVDMSCAQVFAHIAIELGDILTNNPNLKQLLLSHLELGPNTFIKLSSNLSKLRELRHLAITLSSINDENAKNVAKLITNNLTIEKLNLSGCRISLQGKLHIFQILTSLSALQYFSINNIVIGDQLVNELARILSRNVRMKHFEMGNCTSTLTEYKIFTIISSLTKHKQLVHLNFNNNILSDRNLSYLTNLIKENKIQHLELSKCNITSLDTILIFLSLNTLKHLDLSNNPISNIVTTTRQYTFTQVSGLTYLNLSQCQISEKGTEQVVKALTQCKLINHLDLSSNLLNSNSSAVSDLITLISNNSSIETLYMPTCILSDLNIKALFLSLSNASQTLLKFVDLNSNQITDEMADCVAVMMSNSSKLDQLKFSNLVLEESGFEKLKSYLPKFKGLNNLCITGCKITDENAEIISTLINNNQSIENLKICNFVPTHVRNIQSLFNAMRSLKNLLVLSFVYNHLTVPLDEMDDLITMISVNMKLKAIGLGGCALLESNVIAIMKAVIYPQNITHLKLEHIPLSILFIMTLSDLQIGSSGLEQLTLSNCKITGEELSYWKGISDMSKLKYLNLSKNPISILGAELIQNMITKARQLQYLNLSSCSIQPEKLDQIIIQLKDINSLQYLNINDSKLSDESASKLIAVVIKNARIQQFHFSNCNLKGSQVTDLFNVFKHRTCVKSIDISLNETSSGFTKDLIEVVTRNHFATWIMLSKLELNQQELQILSKTLPLMMKLEHLSITGGRFSHIDACNFATLINNNKCLKFLKISDCVLSDNEKLKIFMAMKNITSLTHLVLNNIAITNQVQNDISTVIAKNTELQHIELTGCLNIAFIRSISTLINAHEYITTSNIT